MTASFLTGNECPLLTCKLRGLAGHGGGEQQTTAGSECSFDLAKPAAPLVGHRQSLLSQPAPTAQRHPVISSPRPFARLCGPQTEPRLPWPSGQLICSGAMYIDSWDSFCQQAEELWRSNPRKTRFVTKYRHCDGKLVLKVTDDSVVSGAQGRGGSTLRWRGAAGGAAAGGARRPRPGAVPTCPRRARPQVLQYKTDQQADLKKIEKLNQLFFALMATGEAPSGAHGRWQSGARGRLLGFPTDCVWTLILPVPACSAGRGRARSRHGSQGRLLFFHVGVRELLPHVCW